MPKQIAGETSVRAEISVEKSWGSGGSKGCGERVTCDVTENNAFNDHRAWISSVPNMPLPPATVSLSILLRAPASAARISFRWMAREGV